MSWVRLLFVFAAVILLIPATAGAGTIDPATYSATIGVGESIVVDKTVTLDASGVSKVDVYFLADNTGSMGGAIASVKSVSSALLTGLADAFADAQFGVGRYVGDPIEGLSADGAYDVIQMITGSSASVTSAIGSWSAIGGGDTPEANLFALHQAATNGALSSGGVGGGEATGWRSGAAKVIVWFGDAIGHTATVGLAEAISALTGEEVIVVAMNNLGSGGGIDGGGQASSIVSATGGSLFNNFRFVAAADVVDTIVTAITGATSTLDLTFSHDAPAGVGVEFILDDPLGYTGVMGGESRTFSVRFTGVTPGVYDFSVFVGPGVGEELDRITVGDIPEPSTFALLGLGLLGFGLVARRRRKV